MFPAGQGDQQNEAGNNNEAAARRRRMIRRDLRVAAYRERNRMYGFEMLLPTILNLNEFTRGPNPRHDRRNFPAAIKCPTCQFSHEYIPFDGKGKPPMSEESKFSHDARACFQSGLCPICFDDNAGPPMVNLICGHWVCVDCFKQLGGKTGDDAEKSKEVAGREEYEAYRARLRAEHATQEEEDDDDDDDELPVRSQALRVIMDMMYPRSDDDDDDDDDLDIDEEDEDTDDDMPVLIDTNNLHGELPGTTNNVVAPTGNQQQATADSNVDDSDSSYPSLRARNQDMFTSNGDNHGEPTASRQPRERFFEASINEGLANMQIHEDDNSSGSEHDSIPPLVSRSSVDDANADGADSVSTENSSVDPLDQLRMRLHETSDSDSSVEIPHLTHGNPATAGIDRSGVPIMRLRGSGIQINAPGGDEDDSSDDSVPPLQARFNTDDDSSDDSIPHLETRLAGQNSSDSSSSADPPYDDDDDDDDVPHLEERRGSPDDSSEDEYDSHLRPQSTVSLQTPARRSEEEWFRIKEREASTKSEAELMRDAREMQLELPENQNIIPKRELGVIWARGMAQRQVNLLPVITSTATIEEHPPLVPTETIPVDGVWALSKTESSCELAFCYVDENRKVQAIEQGCSTQNTKLLSSYSRGVAWIAVKQGENEWRLSHKRPHLDSIDMHWIYKEVYKTVDWVVDRNGDSFIMQEIADENYRLVKVNAQHPQGEIRKEGLKAHGKLYPAREGVWITNARTADDTVVSAELVHETPVIFAAPSSVIDVRFRSTWDREGLIMMHMDNENPSQTILTECKRYEARKRTLPVPIEKIKDFCADGVNAVLVHCQMGELSYELRRAEWRFAKKFVSVQECSSRATIISDGISGGVWLWKKANRGNRILSFVDRRGVFTEEGARFPSDCVVEGCYLS